MLATPPVARVGGERSPALAARRPGPEATGVAACSDVTALMVLVDCRSAWWAAARLVRGAGPLRGVHGLRWAKVMGSGSEGGFGLQPSATRGGLFCVFDSRHSAQEFLHHSLQMAQYRDHSREFASVMLRPYASRGSWDGRSLETSAAGPGTRCVAALTRASIRPLAARDFWRRAPPAQVSLESAEGCRLGVGLGEAPLLRQATFSLWDSVQAMDAYARRGAHLEAIRASREGAHFSESMFVRFVPEDVRGAWKGQHLG